MGNLQNSKSGDSKSQEKFLVHKDAHFRVLDVDHQNDFCWIDMEIINSDSRIKLLNTTTEVLFEDSSNVQLQLYPKYMLVNKTIQDIYVGDFKVRARSNDIVPLGVGQNKIKLSCMYYKDSIEIDLSKIGLIGQVEMNSKDENSFKQLQFGISITQAPAPYNKTILLTVAPRYIIVNMLDYPVLIQQFAQESKQNIAPSLISQHIKMNQQELHLQRVPQSCKTPNHITFTCILDRNRIPPALNEKGIGKYWARPFSIETLNDFQTKMQLHPFDPAKNATGQWYQPSEYNSMTQISRISIIPSDEQSSCFFVILSNPIVEEYVIKNKTEKPMVVCKYLWKFSRVDPCSDIQLAP